MRSTRCCSGSTNFHNSSGIHSCVCPCIPSCLCDWPDQQHMALLHPLVCPPSCNMHSLAAQQCSIAPFTISLRGCGAQHGKCEIRTTSLHRSLHLTAIPAFCGPQRVGGCPSVCHVPDVTSPDFRNSQDRVK